MNEENIVVELKEEKTNISRLIKTIILLTIVIGGGLFYFLIVKDNGTANEKQPKVYMYTINIVNDYYQTVIAINNDGTIEELYKPNIKSIDVSFEVNNNKLFLGLSEYEKISFGYIDLTKENNPSDLVIFKEIPSPELGREPIGFTVLNDKIYYVKGMDNKIYEYDVLTNEEKTLEVNYDSNNSLILSSTIYNKLFYYKNDGLYEYDLNENKETRIAAGHASMCFIRNDKLIYYVFDTEDYWNNPQIFYEYDIKTQKQTEMFKSHISSFAIGIKPVIPYNNGYLYIDDNKIYEYNANQGKELIYTLDNDIDYINLIPGDKLLIRTIVDMGEYIDGTLDLSNKQFTEGIINFYTYNQYVE